MTATLPYAFDCAAYRGCYDFPLAAMDERHVYLLHGILASYPFESALEIGSFNGASATAFVEAINRGTGLGERGIATFCDVSPSPSLFDVVGNCRDLNRVRITPQPSWAVLDSNEPFDFIFVDAAHDLDSVSLEVKKLLRRNPLCIMAHDTAATEYGFTKCEGAQMLKETYLDKPEWYCLEDAEKREGERTERGLFFATTSRELYERARAVFAEWG